MASSEIKIYGKTYKVKPISSSVDMQDVAALVDAKMRELSGVKGKSSTVDVAVLTALNLGHELMELKQTRQGDSDQHSQRIDGMVQKLEESLEAIKSKGVSGS
ncbi:MAG TPA: cell division protein ZapA [Nitrospinaceae bacterium]|jgi:cell division protein ZapA|nr:cell division protein ZapA [Nitrospinaceae bacterium]MDP7147154.1 cell division protein ZapA [Nitrospinaceae bacterium]HAX45399.1 cell division protein ZapA [Nitrospina sp.]HJO58416.1 cell division protein ZapA [Nitrospinaceae bacterium]|tara:strand:- start:7844 stop:8152 length:309 start_codon:yes stop_codon:yes gene_type:complete